MNEMALTAILFPGQGSQSPGMRETVQRVRPDLLEAVGQALGEDPFLRVEEGTQYAQPAIFCASLAGWTQMGAPRGDVMAGHSLGELAALVAAGCLREQDGLKLVVLRGALMQRAGEMARCGQQEAPAGGMLALLGTGAAEHASAIAARHGLAVANDNCPTQVVLSGRRSRLAEAAVSATDLGLRAMEVPVSGAFHSPMMEPAVAEFAAALERVEFSPGRVPVLSAVSARPFDDPRRRLAQALTMPVRWRETILELRQLGAERFVEVGPGRVLSGLARRTLSGVELVHA